MKIYKENYRKRCSTCRYKASHGEWSSYCAKNAPSHQGLIALPPNGVCGDWDLSDDAVILTEFELTKLLLESARNATEEQQ